MQGNYLVFWWKDIALGSLFVEANQTVTEAEYMPLLLSVIEPASALRRQTQCGQ